MTESFAPRESRHRHGVATRFWPMTVVLVSVFTLVGIQPVEAQNQRFELCPSQWGTSYWPCSNYGTAVIDWDPLSGSPVSPPTASGRYDDPSTQYGGREAGAAAYFRYGGSHFYTFANAYHFGCPLSNPNCGGYNIRSWVRLDEWPTIIRRKDGATLAPSLNIPVKVKYRMTLEPKWTSSTVSASLRYTLDDVNTTLLAEVSCSASSTQGVVTRSCAPGGAPQGVLSFTVPSEHADKIKARINLGTNAFARGWDFTNQIPRQEVSRATAVLDPYVYIDPTSPLAAELEVLTPDNGRGTNFVPTIEVIDWDDDGHFAPWDCNDADPSVNPISIEVADGQDNNCDAMVDLPYLPIDLGTLGGRTSRASALNNSRHVVGSSRMPSQQEHAFVWTKESGMLDLGTLGGSSSYAHDINNLGYVVGQSFDPTPAPPLPQHAFLVVPEDTNGDGKSDRWYRDDDGNGLNDLMIDLGTLGGQFAAAVAINDVGQLVGRSNTAQGEEHGFLITPQDTNSDGVPDTWYRDLDGDGSNDLMIDLGRTPDLAIHSFAGAVNNLGQILVVARDPTTTEPRRTYLITPEDTDSDGVPDLWSRDANSDGVNDLMVDLGSLQGSVRTWARSINDRGQVAGCADPGSTYFGLAFIVNPLDRNGDGVPDTWNHDFDGDGANDFMSDLGTLGGQSNCAHDVNRHGQVIGLAHVQGTGCASLFETRAFLWTPRQGMLNPPGVSLGCKNPVLRTNDHGDVVGESSSSDGETHAVIWVKDNTPVGSQVVVKPLDVTSATLPVAITFDQVNGIGATVLTTNIGGADPPSGFQLGDPPRYYEVETTASYTGTIRVCINYLGVTFVDETALKLYHLENGQWVDVTVSLDPARSEICGVVSSFSAIALFEPARTGRTLLWVVAAVAATVALFILAMQWWLSRRLS